MAKDKKDARRRAARLDRGLLKRLAGNYRRGGIVILGTGDFVGRAVREGQRKLTVDGEPSRWSHVFLFGDRRLACRGGGTRPGPAIYIYESHLNVDAAHGEVRNGAQENWLGRWCLPGVEHCATIDLGLARAEAELVLASARGLVDDQLNYPLQGLFGTWLAIISNTLWRANPLKSRHAMFCSSFARHCYRRADRDFLPRRISLSNTAPEHIARAAEEQGRLDIIRPGEC